MESTPLAAVAAAEAVARAHLKTPELAAETVELLREVPGVRPNTGTQHFLEATAWLAAVFKEVPGATVEGVPEHVIYAAKKVAGEEWMTLNWYYRMLDGESELVKIVKVAGHIVKLCHAPKGHFRSETSGFIKALTLEMGEPWKTCLNEKLDEATDK